MNLPDLTKAQLTAIAGQLIAFAVAFGANLTPDQQKTLVAAAVAFGSVLVWADKEIRKHRAQNSHGIAMAKEAEAAKQPVPLAFTHGVNATTTTTKKPAAKKPAVKKPPPRGK